MNDEHRRADNDRRWRAPANETKTETGAAPAPVPLGTIRRLIGRGRAIHVWG